MVDAVSLGHGRGPTGRRTPVLRCAVCGRVYEPRDMHARCRACGGLLLPVSGPVSPVTGGRGVWVFSDNLVSSRLGGPRITLGEGGTPLLRARRLAPQRGDLYIKDESRNPTGTFIDRGAATLVSAAAGQGYRRLAAASLGDLAVSLGAYARRAGLRLRAILPRTADLAKTYQSMIYADRVDVVGEYEEALEKLGRIGSEATLPVDSANPFLMDGYKTLYYEVYLELGRHPDVLVVPVGDGALLTALWLASRDLGGRPLFVGVRGCGDTPLLKDISPPRPLLSGIIEKALGEAGGYVMTVCEDEVLEAIRVVAAEEGLLLEPAGVAALAAVRGLGDRLAGKLVVAVATGGPLRDSAVLRLLVGNAPPGTGLGATKLRVLEIIASRGPIHPYGVWRVLRDAYRVDIDVRTVYQHVRELEAMGYVEPAGRVTVRGRDRTLYRASEKALGLLG